MKKTVLPLALVVLLLAGCASQAPQIGPGADTGPVAGTPLEGESKALGLVNLWRVSGAAGESEATWLRLEQRELQLWRDCGMITGSWIGNDSLFLSDIWGAMGDCASDQTPVVEWLSAAASFRATDAGYELLDRDGAVVASLSIDGAPQPIPSAAPSFAEPPVITDEVRAAFARPAFLPASLTPASPADLEGRWVPAGFSGSTDPHLLAAADGNWTGSDGCNGAQGRWAAGAEGAFLATSGPQTMIACDGAPVAYWVSSATTAGFDAKGQLLLFDAAGTHLGTLVR